jgi:hypothetical protein
VLQLRDGFIKAPLLVIKEPQRVVSIPIIGTKIDGFLISRFGVGNAVRVFIRVRHSAQGVGIARVQV